ncbi:hypothetical protein K0U07_02080 [bacterium]|nr:hypothetical protein [bacterium]
MTAVSGGSPVNNAKAGPEAKVNNSMFSIVAEKVISCVSAIFKFLCSFFIKRKRTYMDIPAIRKIVEDNELSIEGKAKKLDDAVIKLAAPYVLDVSSPTPPSVTREILLYYQAINALRA